MKPTNTVKIKTNADGCTSLWLNGVFVAKRCYGYRLIQEGGNAPILELTLACDDVEVETEVTDPDGYLQRKI